MPVPNFAPYEVPMLICPECGNRMRLEIKRYPIGKVESIDFFCDTCKYGHRSSMPHHMGTLIKYEERKPTKPVEEKPVQPVQTEGST